MRVKVFTNKTFEKYINKTNYRRKYEDRWDSLDFDDIANIDVPSNSEVDQAVSNLSDVDKIALKTGADDLVVDNDGKIRLLDLDDIGKKPRKKIARKDNRFATLDLDAGKKQRKKRTGKDDRFATLDLDDSDYTDDQQLGKSNRYADLDMDDAGSGETSGSSGIGAIGILDYDDDVSTDNIIATIDDVYIALSSDNPKVVESIIKRYANDITDKSRAVEVLLAQAVKINYDCLRILCGDMKVSFTTKEKQLNYCTKEEVTRRLNWLKSIASTLSGVGNTYGLIPNAIVSCSKSQQTDCINLIDFLISWCNLPLLPVYFRGSVSRKLYDVARFILDELPAGSLSRDIVSGNKGLFARIIQHADIPKALLSDIIAKSINKRLPIETIGDATIVCIKNNFKAGLKQIDDTIDFESYKGDLVIEYIDDSDAVASNEIHNYVENK